MPTTRVTLPIFGSTYNRPDFINLGQRKLLNMYLEEKPDTGEFAVIGTPGSELWVNTGGDQIRAMLAHHDTLYVVTDDVFYSINSAGNKTFRGNLTTSTGNVVMVGLNDQIVMADGTDCYCFTISGPTFANISDMDLPNNVQHITAANEYVLYVQPDSAIVYVSDLSSATSINALSFFTCGASFDNVKSAITCQNRAYFMGDTTTEIWYPSGGQTVPFDREAVIQIGTFAPFSRQVIGNSVYWLGKNKDGFMGLVVANGSNVQPIPNKDFITKVNSYPTTSVITSFGWVDQHNGHIFYNITFPSVGTETGHTWAYDITNNSWLERTTWNPNKALGAGYDRYIANCSEYFNGYQIVGDFQSGKIYKLLNSVYDDNGYEIEREVTSLHLTYKDLYFSASNLQLNFEGGLGDDTTLDPKVMIYTAKDWGHTYDGPIVRSVGGAGEFRRRTRVGSLGGGYALTLNFRMTDPVPWKIVGGSIDLNIPGSAGG